MSKGGFLKIEALGFNLDTSSVSSGYVPYRAWILPSSDFLNLFDVETGKKWQRWEREKVGAQFFESIKKLSR